jgi:MinD-like ATPase involved in chromosome partitioning or flagellar assembly
VIGDCSVICFYSYKGGTGRSVALLNVAAAIASTGKRVGVIDLDFASPGLDSIIGAGRTLLSLQDQLIDPRMNRLKDTIVDLRKAKGWRISGDVILMPASHDVDKISKTPTNQYGSFLLQTVLLPAFIRQFNLDLVILDSGSGMSEGAAIAIGISDTVVVLFRLDKQSLTGTKEVLTLLKQGSKQFQMVGSCVKVRSMKSEAEKFLKQSIDFLLPLDESLEESEEILTVSNTSRPICRVYGAIADALTRESLPTGPSNRK